MIQALNQKTSEKMRKRKMTNSFHGIRPPQLEQPGVQTLRHSSQILEKPLSIRACSGPFDNPASLGQGQDFLN